jgi:predicted extracellular nuclease
LPYTYIFEGRTQTLDHILMSENMVDHLTVVTVPHLNTPYPIAAPDDASPRHTSDHDPVVVIFTFE